MRSMAHSLLPWLRRLFVATHTLRKYQTAFKLRFPVPAIT